VRWPPCELRIWLGERQLLYLNVVVENRGKRYERRERLGIVNQQEIELYEDALISTALYP
jgi:hypothetical protein